jgi:hypothetical protein
LLVHFRCEAIYVRHARFYREVDPIDLPMMRCSALRVKLIRRLSRFMSTWTKCLS